MDVKNKYKLRETYIRDTWPRSDVAKYNQQLFGFLVLFRSY